MRIEFGGAIRSVPRLQRQPLGSKRLQKRSRIRPSKDSWSPLLPDRLRRRHRAAKLNDIGLTLKKPTRRLGDMGVPRRHEVSGHRSQRRAGVRDILTHSMGRAIGADKLGFAL
jgi:hypothetical protein